MKNLLFLFLSTLSFAGCNKDDQENAPLSLTGKTYAAEGYSVSTIGINPGTYKTYKVWQFISDTEVEETLRKNDPTGPCIGKTKNGIYRLSYPKLVIIFSDGTKKQRYESQFLNENSISSPTAVYPLKKQ